MVYPSSETRPFCALWPEGLGLRRARVLFTFGLVIPVCRRITCIRRIYSTNSKNIKATTPERLVPGSQTAQETRF